LFLADGSHQGPLPSTWARWNQKTEKNRRVGGLSFATAVVFDPQAAMSSAGVKRGPCGFGADVDVKQTLMRETAAHP